MQLRAVAMLSSRQLRLQKLLLLHIEDLCSLQKNGLTTAQRALPFEQIPGPPGTGWPLIGHMKLLYEKPAGFSKSWINLQRLQKQYCSADNCKLLRLHLPLLNSNNGKVIVLLEPKDVEQVYRHEGKYPYR